jgi:hypothetical protein
VTTTDFDAVAIGTGNGQGGRGEDVTGRQGVELEREKSFHAGPRCVQRQDRL